MKTFNCMVNGKPRRFASRKAAQRFFADLARETTRLNNGTTDRGETPSGYVKAGQGGGKVKPVYRPAHTRLYGEQPRATVSQNEAAHHIASLDRQAMLQNRIMSGEGKAKEMAKKMREHINGK